MKKPSAGFIIALLLLYFGVPWALDEIKPNYYRETVFPPGISMVGIAVLLLGYSTWLHFKAPR